MVSPELLPVNPLPFPLTKVLLNLNTCEIGDLPPTVLDTEFFEITLNITAI